MKQIEIFESNQQYAPAQKIKEGNHFYIREDLVDNQIAELKQQLAEKEKEIENEKYISGELTSLIDTMRYDDPKIDELKEQLHTQPKEIIEKVEKAFTEYLPLKDKTGAGFYGKLNKILKGYKCT